MLAIPLGQLLVDRLSFGWIALTNEHGTEVAVRGAGKITVFPANFVAKRFEARQRGFIARMVEGSIHYRVLQQRITVAIS